MDTLKQIIKNDDVVKKRRICICTDEDEELEQETDVDETIEKFCSDVVEDTSLDDFDIY